jgi:peroxiredoxin
MPTNLGRVGAAVVAALGLARPAPAPGDEPIKPTASASEANPAVPAAGHSVHGEAFNDGPRQTAYLMPGMGKASFPVTTARPEAQAFVNQGVAQLHSFFYFEAERSFRQAARIDPGCAMAYWGMAMSNVNNAKRAKGFLKDARKRDAKVSKRERLYIDALEALYKEGENDRTRKQNYLLGLEVLVQEFPNDLDARAWLAMVTWQAGNITSRQSVDTVIDTVLQVEPMHPGAHHYRIHLWDGVKPARAERSAGLFGPAAPGIAHAWHMPGHTYTGLRRYHDAAYQQEASARVDHAYMIRDRVMPFEIHNYAHNNQWLVTTYSHIGRVRDGVAVARDLVEQPRDPNKNGKNDGGSPQRSGRIRWAEILSRYELWDDLIAATTSGALDWSDVPLERRQRAYYLGLAYAAKGDAARLAEQIAALKEKGLPDAAASLAELEGYQLLARGDVGPAFDRFAKATGMRPEALARAHVTARNFGFAESTARTGVEKHRDELPPLAALVEILAANGKTREAQEAYRKLAPLARTADPDLPALRRLAPVIASWASNGWSAPRVETPTDDATANRVDLATLGPLTWSPFPAEPIALADTKGADWTLAGHKGRNVVVLFALGGKCAHCMQQLQVFGKEFEALKALNTDLVAVSTDDPEAVRRLKENDDGVKFPMPLLADPKLEVFRRYRAYDDFEAQPLHGTFLVDAAGHVRYQRVSSDPFLDVDFIKAEAARVNRLLKTGSGVK